MRGRSALIFRADGMVYIHAVVKQGFFEGYSIVLPERGPSHVDFHVHVLCTPNIPRSDDRCGSLLARRISRRRSFQRIEDERSMETRFNRPLFLAHSSIV